MRIISNNINQIAKKANETNNINAEDVEKLRNEVESLSHIPQQHTPQSHHKTLCHPRLTLPPHRASYPDPHSSSPV
ncbi:MULTISPECIES: plasmid mobilization relaxosome protein MobC [unclassified Ruminococcus]|uniref:plasmid mobilization relaxosome protein MobC n=1 Tax=unclassified Ruminococcus TaxID=2608920 RepID=UPI001FA6B720|nr:MULTISPECIES: plasmid mobilization relaxosome protein MobC [unclassified Ruminococcus]